MPVANVAEMVGKNVYTKSGKFVGKVDDSMIDSERGSLYGIVIQMAKNSFLYKMFEQSGDIKKAILIPHKHIIACEDILLISMPPKYEEPAAAPPAAEKPEMRTEEEKVGETI